MFGFNKRKRAEEARQKAHAEAQEDEAILRAVRQAQAEAKKRQAAEEQRERQRQAAAAAAQFLIDQEKTGHRGTPQQVYDAAGLDSDYSPKLPLLAGALRAYRAGEPDNLRAFLSGYLAFKSGLGTFSKLPKSDLDEGLVKLVTEPVIALLETSADPRADFVSLATGLSPYFAQIFMDVTLRTATARNKAFICEMLLDLGADVNCHEGRLLPIALGNDALQAAAVLLRHQPDIGLAAARQTTPQQFAKLQSFIEQAKAYPLPPSITESKLLTEIARQTMAKKKPATDLKLSQPSAAAKPSAKPQPPSV